jgi:cysteine protease ATG4
MDPSMLIAFLVKDEADFDHWKEHVVSVQGKSIVHISKSEPPPRGVEREGAVDEVESFDERDDEEGL